MMSNDGTEPVALVVASLERKQPMHTQSSREVGGLLLTGGASERMGVDKARLQIDGVAAADRLGALLNVVTETAFEVGPGHSKLPSVVEEPRGAGPLVAVAAGRGALLQAGFPGPAIVLACDLPFIDVSFLRFLADWPGAGSVIPIVHGYAQPLCSRWSTGDLDLAVLLAEQGERSLRRVPDRATASMLDEDAWAEVATELTFADIDTPGDLVALGISARVDLPLPGTGREVRS